MQEEKSVESYSREQLIYMSKEVLKEKLQVWWKCTVGTFSSTLMMVNKGSQRRQDGTRLINTCLSIAFPAVKREWLHLSGLLGEYLFLNERKWKTLVFLLLCWPPIRVLTLLSVAVCIVLQANGKMVMKKCCSCEWGLQDQALHDQCNPGLQADIASLI